MLAYFDWKVLRLPQKLVLLLLVWWSGMVLWLEGLLAGSQLYPVVVGG